MILFYNNIIYCTVNIKLFFIVNLVRAAARVPRDLTVPRVVRAEQRGDRGENAQPDIIVIF